MSDDFSDILTPSGSGVRLSVRAKPGLSRKRVPQLVDIGDGKRALEITVAEAAKDGKANQALLEQLAGILGLRKSDLEVKTGTTGRLKIIEISGADPAALHRHVRRWLGGLGG